MKHILALVLAFFTFNQQILAQIHYKNASQNNVAQKLFDKGMLNYYGYLYVQAEYDFRQALLHDSHCAMCYWGLAIAKKHQAMELGQSFASVGYEELKQAASLVSPKNDFQYDVIQATKTSFTLNSLITPRQLQLAYINSLRNIYEKYKDNNEWRVESLALLVDAIAYYPSEDNSAIANHCGNMLNQNLKQEAISLLKPVLSNSSFPDHPGLIHTYIHMNEHDLNDPMNLIVAKKLPSFSQGEIAHYTHMPNHIYWRRGMYDQAIRANYDTIAMDQQYFKNNGAGLNSYYYEYHYLHSHHFLAALGMLTANFELAIDNARAVKRLMDANRMSSLIDYRDTFLSLEHVVLARFSKWSEVLQLETPEQTNELGLLFINFSKGLAYLNLGQKLQFKKIVNEMNSQKYKRTNIRELQTLALTYLQVSEMGLNKKSLSEVKQVILKNKIDKIEHKLAVMNPPLWFFPHQLLLSEIAVKQGDKENAKYYHNLFLAAYPNSRLGQC